MSYISLFKLWVRERLRIDSPSQNNIQLLHEIWQKGWNAGLRDSRIEPEPTKTVYIAIAKGTLDEVFKQVREKMNKSVRQGAEMLGVDYSTLQDWEVGANIPSAMIELFAHMYDVKLTTKRYGEWIASIPKVEGYHIPIWGKQFRRFFRAK